MTPHDFLYHINHSSALSYSTFLPIKSALCSSKIFIHYFSNSLLNLPRDYCRCFSWCNPHSSTNSIHHTHFINALHKYHRTDKISFTTCNCNQILYTHSMQIFNLWAYHEFTTKIFKIVLKGMETWTCFYDTIFMRVDE